MKHVGIIAKPDAQKAPQIVEGLIRYLEKKQIEWNVDEDTARIIEVGNGMPKAALVNHVELLIALGGDGTILGVARLMVGSDTPILGVNLGNLGFLTEVCIDQMYLVLDRILGGDYRIDERMMLRCHLHRMGERFAEYHVLNDVVINKGALARIIDLELMVNKQFLTRYRSDGLIVSTPTGSTAYNLAAGGPIIHPSLTNMIITPICPHMLANRSIVIPARNVELAVRVKARSSDVMLTLDGQLGVALQTGDVIHIYKSDATLKMVTNPEKNYYAVLKEKMKWAEI